MNERCCEQLLNGFIYVHAIQERFPAKLAMMARIIATSMTVPISAIQKCPHQDAKPSWMSQGTHPQRILQTLGTIEVAE